MEKMEEQRQPDMIRIDTRHDWEVRYWAELFEVTDKEIRTAVRKVGVLTADVRRYFNAW